MTEPGELRFEQDFLTLQTRVSVYNGSQWVDLGRPTSGSIIQFPVRGDHGVGLLSTVLRQIRVTIPHYPGAPEPQMPRRWNIRYPRAEVLEWVCSGPCCVPSDPESEKAVQRAAGLLLRLLDEGQRTQYRRDKTFDVTGSAGTRFRIQHGVSGNVVVLDDTGAQSGVLCGYPDTYVRSGAGQPARHLPTEDVLVGQLLVLKADEPHFWREANIYRGHPYLEQRRREVLGLPAEPSRPGGGMDGIWFYGRPAIIEGNYIVGPVTEGYPLNHFNVGLGYAP